MFNIELNSKFDLVFIVLTVCVCVRAARIGEYPL